MKQFLKNYSLAFQTLTIFWSEIPEESSLKIRAQVLVFYPVVGLFIGVLLKFFHMGFQTIFPEDIVDFLVVILWVILSRASHVKDLASILITATSNWKTERGSPRSPQRLSAFAAVLLIFTQLLKFLALLQVTPHLKTAAILTMPLTSLWAVVWACYLLGYVSKSSETHEMMGITGLALIIASTITFGVLVIILKLIALPGLIMVMLTTLLLIKWIQRQNLESIESILGTSHELGGIVFLLSLPLSLFLDL